MASCKVQKSTFTLIPEGVDIFKVTNCEDEYEEYGEVTYVLANSKGQTVYNRFRFVNGDGEVNEIGVYYWSKFARACLNMDPDEEPEIEFDSLVGSFVKAEIVHNEYTVKSGKHKGEKRTGANVNDKSYEYARGFKNASPEPEPEATEDDGDDWDF